MQVRKVRSARRQAGWSTVDYDPATNRAWSGSLHLNTRYLTSAATRGKTACHELDHVLGLGHRRAGRTCMRDGFDTLHGHPSAADYAALRRLYGVAPVPNRTGVIPGEPS